jgi:CRISPR/Cas system CSM-associated protein Csm2 small subunit
MRKMIAYAEELRRQGKSEEEIQQIMTEAAKKIKKVK